MRHQRNWKRIRWSSGHVDAAPTWQRLLDMVRLSQWTAWDEQTFRDVLAKRAYRWSGTEIDADAPPRRLFRELERAHLLIVLDPAEKEDEF